LSAARRHLDRSLARQPANPDEWLASSLRAAARLARSEGQVQRSVELACKGLDTAFGRGALLETIELLELVAIVSPDDGYHSKAARLLGAAQVQREVTGYVQSEPLRQELAQVVAIIEAALEPPGSAPALSEGRLLTLDQAVAYACRGRGPRHRPASGWASLTPTERRITSLVAQRLTNAEIAAQMFVSTATVKAHLTRIFAKLGVPGR
jgi:DNA-binding CsgD family transcriptional regulator